MDDNGKLEHQLYVTALWLMLALARIKQLEESRCVVFGILEKSGGMFEDVATVTHLLNENVNKLDARISVLEKVYGIRSISDTIKSLWGPLGDE